MAETEFIKNLEREATTVLIDAANGSHARMSYFDTTLKMWSYIENDGTTKSHMVTLDSNFRATHANGAGTGFGMNALKLFFGPADESHIVDNSGGIRIFGGDDVVIQSNDGLTNYQDATSTTELTIDVSGTDPIIKTVTGALKLLTDVTIFGEVTGNSIIQVTHSTSVADIEVQSAGPTNFTLGLSDGEGTLTIGTPFKFITGSSANKDKFIYKDNSTSTDRLQIFVTSIDQTIEALTGDLILKPAANSGIGIPDVGTPPSPTTFRLYNDGGNLFWNAVQLDTGGGATDKISEGDSSVEVIDTGSDGRVVFTTEGAQVGIFNSTGQLLVGPSFTPTSVGGKTTLMEVRNDANTINILVLNNQTNGTAAGSELSLIQAGTVSGQTFALRRHSTANTTSSDSGIAFSDATCFKHGGKAGDFIFNPATGGNYHFEVGSSEIVKFQSDGKIGFGAIIIDEQVHIQKDQNSTTCVKIENATNGTNAATEILLNQAGSNPSAGFIIRRHSTANTTSSDSGIALADASIFKHSDKPGDFVFNPDTGGNYHFEVGSSEIVKFQSDGKIGFGAIIIDEQVHIQKDQNSTTCVKIENATNGTNAATEILLNQAGSIASAGFLIRRHSTANTGTSDSGIALADASLFTHGAKAGDFIFNPATTGRYIFEIGTAEIFRVSSTGLLMETSNKIEFRNTNKSINSDATDVIRIVNRDTQIRIFDNDSSPSTFDFLVDGTNSLHVRSGGVGIRVSAPAAQLHVDQPSLSGAIPVLTLDQGDIDDTFINYIGTTSADGSRSISSDTTEDSTKFGAFRVEINGVTKWVRVYDNES